MKFLQHLVNTMTVFVDQHLIECFIGHLTGIHLLRMREGDLLRRELRSTNLRETFEHGVEQLEEVLFGQYFDPVSEDQQEAAFEDGVVPLGLPDEAQHVVHV